MISGNRNVITLLVQRQKPSHTHTSFEAARAKPFEGKQQWFLLLPYMSSECCKVKQSNYKAGYLKILNVSQSPLRWIRYPNIWGLQNPSGSTDRWDVSRQEGSGLPSERRGTAGDSRSSFWARNVSTTWMCMLNKKRKKKRELKKVSACLLLFCVFLASLWSLCTCHWLAGWLLPASWFRI